MREKRGNYVRIVVSLPEEVLENIKNEGIPLSLYIRHRVSLMLSSLNVAIGVLRACFMLSECGKRPKRRPIGVYLHEKEYKALMHHVKNINGYLLKYKGTPVSINQVLYVLLSDDCHERKAV